MRLAPPAVAATVILAASVVLFGDYKPTGRLAFTWPRGVAQLPINVGDATYDPLFAFGFGRSY